jgi:hypothetical protein
VWVGAEPWVVELNRGLKGGEIIGVESNIVGIGDGRGRISMLVSLAEDLEFNPDLFEVRVFQGGTYWRMASTIYADTLSEIKATRNNKFGGIEFLVDTTVCDLVPGAMQIIQESEIYNMNMRNGDTDNSPFGLQVNTEIRRIECDLPVGFKGGAYNFTVIHRGFGALKVSEHAWNAQTSYTVGSQTTNTPSQQKYMFKTLIRAETSG